MAPSRRKRRAFTLVEVLVALGLGALVLGALGWLLLTAFRVNNAAGLEMDLTGLALRVFRRTSRDIMASRGIVRFQPDGAAGTADGLQMKNGALVVYQRRDDAVWRAVYGPPPHKLVGEEELGYGFAYFHMYPMQYGIHIALELDRSLVTGASYGSDPASKRVELSTVVVARGW